MDVAAATSSGFVVAVAALGGLYALAFDQLRCAIETLRPEAPSLWRLGVLGLGLAVLAGLGAHGPMLGLDEHRALGLAPAALGLVAAAHAVLVRRPRWALCLQAPELGGPLRLRCRRCGLGWALVATATALLAAGLQTALPPSVPLPATPVIPFAAALVARGLAAAGIAALALGADAAASLALAAVPDGAVAALFVLAVAGMTPAGRS